VILGWIFQFSSVRFSQLSQAYYIPRSSHPLWIYHLIRIYCRVQIMKLFRMPFPPASHNFLYLRKACKYPFDTHILTPYTVLFSRARDEVSRVHKTKGGPGQLSRYSHSLRAGRSEDRIPVRGEIFCTRPDRPWGPINPLYNGYRVSFPGVKYWDVALTTQPT